uniref:Uncharacterized protein n=1 Tax=Macrostomum lignano TaxID=282301 RepID=A0A1I8FAS3_9PLAT
MAALCLQKIVARAVSAQTADGISSRQERCGLVQLALSRGNSSSDKRPDPLTESKKPCPARLAQRARPSQKKPTSATRTTATTKPGAIYPDSPLPNPPAELDHPIQCPTLLHSRCFRSFRRSATSSRVGQMRSSRRYPAAFRRLMSLGVADSAQTAPIGAWHRQQHHHHQSPSHYSATRIIANAAGDFSLQWEREAALSEERRVMREQEDFRRMREQMERELRDKWESAKMGTGSAVAAWDPSSSSRDRRRSSRRRSRSRSRSSRHRYEHRRSPSGPTQPWPSGSAASTTNYSGQHQPDAYYRHVNAQELLQQQQQQQQRPPPMFLGAGHSAIGTGQ